MLCATGWRNAESHNRKTSLGLRGRLRAAFFFEVDGAATRVLGKPSLALFTLMKTKITMGLIAAVMA